MSTINVGDVRQNKLLLDWLKRKGIDADFIFGIDIQVSPSSVAVVVVRMGLTYDDLKEMFGDSGDPEKGKHNEYVE